MRSKSELLIAEKLYEFDVPFRYEEIIHINGQRFSPDFRIMLPDKGVKYWEHCGMMENMQYRIRNSRKMTEYEKAGIVPWKNLIITYDTMDGGINLAAVEAEIRNKLLV